MELFLSPLFQNFIGNMTVIVVQVRLLCVGREEGFGLIIVLLYCSSSSSILLFIIIVKKY